MTFCKICNYLSVVQFKTRELRFRSIAYARRHRGTEMRHPLSATGFFSVVLPSVYLFMTVSLQILVVPRAAAVRILGDYLRQGTLQESHRRGTATLEPLTTRERRLLVPLHDLRGDGFTELFVKRRKGETEDELEEAPTTSSQHRAAWREEERHAEHPMCTDVGFRGLHPEEGGEEA